MYSSTTYNTTTNYLFFLSAAFFALVLKFCSPLSSCRSMAILDVKFRLTLNDFAVPVVKKTMPVIDPYQLSEGLDMNFEDEVEISLLSLKATADMTWLQKALKLHHRWWVRNHSHIPLLLEIRELIKKNKVYKGSGARLPREHESMVLLKVRERIICVQNLPNIVILGLTGTPGAPQGGPEDEVGALQWFLQELQKDIGILQGQEQEPADPSKVSKTPVAEEHQDAVEECIKSLVKHPHCQRAWYIPSRRSFRVVKKDKSSSDFRVRAASKRKHGEQEDNEQFHKALSAAMEFLEPSDSAPAPLPDAPQGDSQPSDMEA